MPATIEVKNPLVYVGGLELTREQLRWLMEMRIDLELRLPGRVTLRFQDPHGELAGSGTFALGTSVSVRVPGGSTIIDGEITGLGYEASTGPEPKERLGGRTSLVNEFVVTAYDLSHRLTRNSTVSGLSQMTASDIVSKVASGAGLIPNVTSTSLVYPSVAQAHRDFDLLNALADREGFDWWVSSGNTLHFKAPVTSSTATLQLGSKDLESFSVHASGMHPDKVSVRGWDPGQQQKLVGDAEVTGSATWPQNVTMLQDFRQAGSALGGDGAVISAQFAPTSLGDSQAIAKGVADRIAAASVVARGVGEGNASIQIGSSVTVEGAGPIDGVYHVTKVEHVVRPTSYKTRFVAGDRAPRSLADAVGLGAQPRFPLLHYGLVIGKVTNLGDAQNPGLIKVSYPGLEQQLESGWARFLAVGAGDKSRGLVLLPEIDDEVLVGFEGGDVHRPVVLGGLYSERNSVGEWDVQGGKAMSRRFISRQGHIIEFKDGDTDPTKHVKVQVKKGEDPVFVRVGADKIEVTSPSGVPIVLKTGASTTVELKQDGSIAVAGSTIDIKGSEKVSITAPTVELNADRELSLQSGDKATLKSMEAEISGAMEVAVKGMEVKIN